MSPEDNNEKLLTVIRRWTPRLNNPPPPWWEWAVAAAQYHQPDCDWMRSGVSYAHCSCALTRVIAKIIEETKRNATSKGETP